MSVQMNISMEVLWFIEVVFSSSDIRERENRMGLLFKFSVDDQRVVTLNFLANSHGESMRRKLEETKKNVNKI